MSIAPHSYSPEEKLKLYMIARAEALFAACMNNHAAQEVLRRQPVVAKGLKGIER